MQNYKTALITAIMGLLGVLVMGSLSPSVAQVVVDCNSGGVLQDAINDALPNETILVTGTCNENIRIDSSIQDLTIDGQGSARIIAADDNMATVSIFGRGITIQNFNGDGSINGGLSGVLVSFNASASIKNNTIEGAKTTGIGVEANSFAIIVGNLVRNHGGNGIAILESSSARIGGNCTQATFNAITGNGASGIALSRNAEASIRGNLIQANGTNGIFVTDGSMADTSSNTIILNGGDGIEVRRGSSVRMGRRDTPEPGCFENPNETFPAALNAGYGIDCQSLSTVDGVLGSLNGANGATDLKDDNSDCPNCCFAFVDLEAPPANEPPEAAFTFTADNLTVDFEDLSTDSDGSVVAWSWDFGDGSGTSTEQNPSYTYAAAGIYDVSLTVTDDQDAVSEPAEDSVAVTAPPSGNVVQVFVTNASFSGLLGGLSGADDQCLISAQAAGLTGTWTAWLSNDNTPARDRIPDGQYQLLDGTVIAEDKDDLTDGRLNAPINLTELDTTRDGFVWTGTDLVGSSAESNCSNWTNQSAPRSCSTGDPDCGFQGMSNQKFIHWTKAALQPCDATASLYCFGGGQ